MRSIHLLGQRLDGSDRFLIVASLAWAGVFGFLTFNDSILMGHFGFSEPKGRAVGEVVELENNTRRRAETSLIWFDLSESDELFENDVIYSGDDSKVKMTIADQGSLTLGPNTMMTLNFSQGNLALNLMLGSASADLKEGAQLVVQQGEEQATIKSGSAGEVLFTKVKDGGVKLITLNTPQNVKVGTTEEQISKLQEAYLFGRKLLEKKNLLIELIKPQTRRRLWRFPQEPINFEWKSGHEGQKFTFELAKDSDFEDLLRSDSVTGTSWEVADLEVGRYHWRVSSEDGDHKSPVFYFRVDRVSAPILEHPENGVVPLPEGEAVKKLDFIWSKLKKVKKYKFQLSSNIEFSELIAESQIKRGQNRVRSMELPVGQYYWRVAADVPVSNKDKLWSKVGEFYIGDPASSSGVALAPLDGGANVPGVGGESGALEGPQKLDEAPDVVVPELLNKKQYSVMKFKNPLPDRSLASVKEALENPISLKWKALPDQKAELLIARNKKFSKILQTHSLEKNQFRFYPPGPGKYYWKVKNEVGESELGQVGVGVVAPEVNRVEPQKKSFTDYERFKKTALPMELSWSEVPFAQGYLVELLKDSSNEKVLKTFRTPASSVKVKLKRSGKYFYRVRATGRGGRSISSFSKLGELNVEKSFVLKTPKIKFPNAAVTVVSFGGKLSSPLLFTWARVKSAKSYTLQFSQNKNFSTLLHEKEVTEVKSVFQEETPNGKVYWRLRANRGEFSSEWTDPRFFEVGSN